MSTRLTQTEIVFQDPINHGALGLHRKFLWLATWGWFPIRWFIEQFNGTAEFRVWLRIVDNQKR